MSGTRPRRHRDTNKRRTATTVQGKIDHEASSTGPESRSVKESPARPMGAPRRPDDAGMPDRYWCAGQGWTRQLRRSTRPSRSLIHYSSLIAPALILSWLRTSHNSAPAVSADNGQTGDPPAQTGTVSLDFALSSSSSNGTLASGERKPATVTISRVNVSYRNGSGSCRSPALSTHEPVFPQLRDRS